MRIVVSVQSKRGSSRGLVHYIAHSKIDPEREPASGREIFNSFGDSMSVRSANNLLKADISTKRPSNDELHHLVFSFRKDDFTKLGVSDRQRIHSMKEIVRASMAELEKSLHGDRLSWAAAVHLNTANPHVHIAIQKRYFSRDLRCKDLSKIPREALPHYKKAAGGKELMEGYMHWAALERMQQIVNRDRSREARVTEPPRRRDNDVAEILARWLRQKSELTQADLAVESLMKNGDRRRFLVSDPTTGRKQRVSLKDLERRAGTAALRECKSRGISDTDRVESVTKRAIAEAMDPRSPVVRQLRAILHNLVVKEEMKRFKLVDSFRQIDRKMAKVRSDYRKNDLKLPTPSLTKDELDLLQSRSQDANDIRGLAYLERVRKELEGSGQIDQRTSEDIGKLTAQKIVADLRSRSLCEDARRACENRYSRRVEIDGRMWSVARSEKEESLHSGLAAKVFKKIGLFPQSRSRSITREQVLEKLDVEDREMAKAASAAKSTVNVLEGILKNNVGSSAPDLSIEEIAAIETSSLKLRDAQLYESSFQIQYGLIAGSRISTEKQTGILAGRALAREIVAEAAYQNTRDELQKFSSGKRFHKFEIVDNNGSVRFVALNDVETHRSGSILDQAIERVVESPDQRTTRTVVNGLIKEKKQRLQDDVLRSGEILNIAAKIADQFKTVSYFGLRKWSEHTPIFSAAELAMIERRIERSDDRREVRRLEKIFREGTEQPTRSLVKIFRDFVTLGDSDRKREEHRNDLIR